MAGKKRLDDMYLQKYGRLIYLTAKTQNLMISIYVAFMEAPSSGNSFPGKIFLHLLKRFSGVLRSYKNSTIDSSVFRVLHAICSLNQLNPMC